MDQFQNDSQGHYGGPDLLWQDVLTDSDGLIQYNNVQQHAVYTQPAPQQHGLQPFVAPDQAQYAPDEAQFGQSTFPQQQFQPSNAVDLDQYAVSTFGQSQHPFQFGANQGHTDLSMDPPQHLAPQVDPVQGSFVLSSEQFAANMAAQEAAAAQQRHMIKKEKNREAQGRSRVKKEAKQKAILEENATMKETLKERDETIADLQRDNAALQRQLINMQAQRLAVVVPGVPSSAAVQGAQPSSAATAAAATAIASAPTMAPAALVPRHAAPGPGSSALGPPSNDQLAQYSPSQPKVLPRYHSGRPYKRRISKLPPAPSDDPSEDADTPRKRPKVVNTSDNSVAETDALGLTVVSPPPADETPAEFSIAPENISRYFDDAMAAIEASPYSRSAREALDSEFTVSGLGRIEESRK